MDLNDYYYFVQVAEKGGISKASRALNIPKSRLSRHIRQLEERLKVRLIQRNSRNFVISELGEEFYQLAREALDKVEAAEAAIESATGEITGTVTLSCSVGMAQYLVVDALVSFIDYYPNVRVIQNVTNRTIDLLEDGIDIALRGHDGPLPSSSLIQRRLADTPWLLFASPDFLKRYGPIDDPAQLVGLPALKLGWRGSEGQWLLKHSNGNIERVEYHSSFSSDDMFSLKMAAIASKGIVSLPGYVCKNEIRSGSLVPILPEWKASDAQISLIRPSKLGILPAVKALTDHLVSEVPRLIDGK